jgi:hypothetical protein
MCAAVILYVLSKQQGLFSCFGFLGDDDSTKQPLIQGSKDSDLITKYDVSDLVIDKPSSSKSIGVADTSINQLPQASSPPIDIPGKVPGNVPGKSSKLDQFRANKKCTIKSDGSCDELAERYKKIHQRLIDKDPSAADKTIIGRHHVSWCSYCHKNEPIYNMIVNELLNGNTESKKYVFVNFDETDRPAIGINEFPTITKYTPDGTLSVYLGKKCDEVELQKWIKHK